VPDQGADGLVVALGLGSALAWGAADFGGGLTTRRSALFGVVLVTTVTGMVIASLLAILRGEPVPGAADVGWSALSGVFGTIGILALYGGLAAGRMGVVAPVTGVLAASVPVAVGIALEGLPGPVVLFGIGLAIVAVLLVSITADAGPEGRPSGLAYGIAAGLGLGLLAVTLSRVTDGLVFGPLVILRGVQVVLVVAVVVLSGRAWRLDRRILPAAFAVGLLDMAGNGLFLAAAQAGPLAIAAVVSSLYPVTTVVLATLILRERLGVGHGVGVLCALAAIVCIGLGSAA
jgi:drug/metabolite transporter (DMT)-like permease